MISEPLTLCDVRGCEHVAIWRTERAEISMPYLPDSWHVIPMWLTVCDDHKKLLSGVIVDKIPLRAIQNRDTYLSTGQMFT